MLGQQKIQDLMQRALRLSNAAETEVLVESRDVSLTRFASNAIHQNVAETNVRVIIRAVEGKRTGLASTTGLSDEALRLTAERALTHARQQPENPDYPGLADPEPIAPVPAFDETTAAFSPEERARAVRTVCGLAAGDKLQAFGAFRTTVQESGLANSRGVLAYHPLTHADFQTVVMGADGTGRAQASSWKVQEVNVERLGREAVQKALRAQNPRAIEPGEYTVVVDPYVTQDLLAWLNFSGASAQAVQEGRSWMIDRIGQPIMSPLVSIWDDGRDVSGAPMPFDFEGSPRQHVQIVDRGVVLSPVYDRYTAAKEGKRTTGHAQPPGFSFFTGPLAFNLFMAGGNCVGRSISSGAVHHPSGIALVHPRDCIITGMTRRRDHRERELTFPVRACASHNLASRRWPSWPSGTNAPAHRQMGGATRIPALKIRRFNFTGITV
jgi:predicted Zn-dependent protease